MAYFGSRFALANKDYQVMVFDPKKLVMRRQHRLHKGLVRTMGFVEDVCLISGGDDHKLIDFDLGRGKLSQKLDLRYIIKQIQICSNKQEAVVGTCNGIVHLIDLRELASAQSFSFANSLSSMSLYRDNGILCCNKEGKISFYDLRKTRSAVMENISDQAWSCISSYENLILAGSNDLFVS